MDTFKRRAYVYDYEAPPLHVVSMVSMDTFNGERMSTTVTLKHHHRDCGKQAQPPSNPAPEESESEATK
jgi:hypothetical protein